MKKTQNLLIGLAALLAASIASGGSMSIESGGCNIIPSICLSGSGGAILPYGPASTATIGSQTLPWPGLYLSGALIDGAGTSRINFTNTTSANKYMGASSNGASVVANQFGNANSLTAGTDRYIAGFYRDALSSAQLYIASNGTLLPVTDNGPSLGSATNRFNVVWSNNYQDGQSVGRLVFGTAAANNYKGNAADSAAAVAHKFGNNTAMTANTDRFIAEFYSDNMSTARWKMTSAGAWVAQTAVAYPRGTIELVGGDYICLNGDCSRKIGATATTSGDFHFTDSSGTNYLRIIPGSSLVQTWGSLQVQGGSVTSAGSGSNRALTLVSDVANNAAVVAINFQGGNSLTQGIDRFIARYSPDNGSTGVLRITTNGSIDFLGVATGSLGTCDANAAGMQQYDTTTTTMKYCNGSAWTTMSGVSKSSGSSTQDLASMNTNTCAASFTVTTTGMSQTNGATCECGPSVNGWATFPDLQCYAYPTDTNTVSVTVCNNGTTGAQNPGSLTYYVNCIQ